MAQYLMYNGPMPSTASQAAVASGTAIKTMIQIKPSATKPLKVKKFGISFDGTTANTPGIVEFLEDANAATVTAFAAADITKYDGEALIGGDPTTNLIQVGTSASGYTSSNENTAAPARMLDAFHLSPTGIYVHEFSLGLEPVVQISKFLKMRVKFGTTVNIICWVLVEI